MVRAIPIYRFTRGLHVTCHTNRDGLITRQLEVGVPEDWKFEFARATEVAHFFISTRNVDVGDIHLRRIDDDELSDPSQAPTVIYYKWGHNRWPAAHRAWCNVTYLYPNGEQKEICPDSDGGMITFERLPREGEDISDYKPAKGWDEYLIPRGWRALLDPKSMD